MTAGANYVLEKAILSDAEFDRMGWHDCRIHALAFDSDHLAFMLDLDYIFQWVHPKAGETCFKFWVAPCTMVFENANVRFDLEAGYYGPVGLEIQALRREVSARQPEATDMHQFWQFTFECQEGQLTVCATGFKQHVRRSPILLRGQRFDLAARGGISFVKTVGG